MEADDLDNLIACSLGGVNSALETQERKKAAPAAPAAAESAAAARSSAGEAVRELQQGPARSEEETANVSEDFFCNLVKTFQEPEFQKAMQEALQAEGASPGASSAQDAAKPAGEVAAKAPAPATEASTGGSAGSNSDKGVEDFLQNFLKSFDSAVSSDSHFEQKLSSLMTSMLSNDLICEPLKQIVTAFEPWLKSQKGLSASDRNRYEAQLRTYKQIIAVYEGSPDPLPDNAREEVQRLLSELHAMGQPPEEVMKQIAPKEAEEDKESFEEFVKHMGLDSNLGASEQDLLKKLSEDPEELTKVMKDMADGLPEEACKQQ